ncbi:pre-mRNA 3' end processing protein WDR33 [Porphyridium purpureum]|uniref:Pre-mRNA 3' end processing protein WDR33 n=1 Tax=Porphyridium purpureum TaxID=35688 RepID=A0A5J4YVA5_PORPP|nr:pre-mRNA 3' end processing protein WDR33 [Porphyridium purpureum]|eukprot:POR0919..scf209_3
MSAYDPGDRGGGYYSRPAGRYNEVFDGKQLRKAVQRRTIDYNASSLKWLVDRPRKTRAREYPSILPRTEYALNLYPPSAPCMKANSVTSVCTKFVHSSVNKPRCPINSCAWTPEGKRLITGAATGEFTLWHGLTFNFETILQAHSSAVRVIQWSRNAYWMVTGDQQGVIKYWQGNMNNLKAFQAHSEAIRDVSFSATDLKFATCSDDGVIKVWDFELVQEENVLKGHGWDVRCVDWHPSYPILASGSKDALVKLWDAKSGKCLTTLHGHKNMVVKTQWNHNGNWLVTGSRDQLIKMFDIRMMKEIMTFRGHKKEVTSLSWHPVHEDLFASGGWDGALYFWQVGQDEPVACVANAHQSSIWDIDWHPCGHMLVSASGDHTTKFWTRNRPGEGKDMMSDFSYGDATGADNPGGAVGERRQDGREFANRY